MASMFDRSFFRAIRRADVVLATADRPAIEEMCQRSAGVLAPEHVRVWPTRVDTSVFCPAVMHDARTKLKLNPHDVVIVTTGRINWFKGWSLLLESLRVGGQRWKLIFVGDGEDREKLLEVARTTGVSDRVAVTGSQSPRQVATYIQAANVFVLASHHEGFSTSMLEALACGKPIVSTAVSSADTIIEQGVNGFVVSSRCSHDFHAAIGDALALSEDHVRAFNTQRVAAYAIDAVRKDLISVWPMN
jgi:glycosyltransferase involved in cell wall biosynthesis